MTSLISCLQGMVYGKGAILDTLLNSSLEGNLINEESGHHTGKQVPTTRI